MKKLILVLTLNVLSLMACSPKNSDLYHEPQSEPVPQFEPVKDSDPIPTYEQPKSEPIKPLQQDPPPESKKVDTTTVVPAEEPRPQKTDVFEIKKENLPQVDVLFVMDTSDSMKNDLDRLEKNIDNFIGAFLKNEFLDFHIGVVTAWDNRLFHSVADQKDCKLGELRPVGGGKCTNNSSPRFVTRDTPQLKTALSSLLKQKIEPFNKKNPVVSGPEKEEFFSPIMNALSDASLSTFNKSFRRDRANLVVAVFTDGDDGSDGVDGSSNYDPSQVAQFLNSFKKDGVKVMTFGALARYTEMQDCEKLGRSLPAYRRTLPGCRELDPSAKDLTNKEAVDPDLNYAGAGPYRLREFLEKTRTHVDEQNIFDLSSPHYGAEIGVIAQNIVKESEDISLRPTQIVDRAQPITVKYGNLLIPQSDKGWALDKNTDRVMIRGTSLNKRLTDAKVTITYTPVPLVEAPPQVLDRKTGKPINPGDSIPQPKVPVMPPAGEKRAGPPPVPKSKPKK